MYKTFKTRLSSVLKNGVRRATTQAPVNNDDTLLAACKAFIPPMTVSNHKGQQGRIAVIGGCMEYTGAPYFAAISALKCGADLAHIFCMKEAAPVIKMYSPELIVHPILDSENAPKRIMEWADRMHCFVIGPGLGRDPKILKTVAEIIIKIKEMGKPFVVDADGLFLITSQLNLIRNYQKVILTPNEAEFTRLIQAAGPKYNGNALITTHVKELAYALGNVTVLRKGTIDIASNGSVTVCSSGGGSPRRCGGQGDLLSGALAVLFHWALAYGDEAANLPPELLAIYGSCRLARECAHLAFAQNGRATTTTDIINFIHPSFGFLFGP